jgi:predicted acetyltransferase
VETYEVGPLAGEAEVDAAARVLAVSFAVPDAESRGWLADRLGLANVRVVRAHGAVNGALALVPMGQFFGGRSVPCAGVVAVGVPPEARGRGAAQALMRGVLEELRGRGVALSALYPANQALYRGVGYEAAGDRFELRLAPAAVAPADRALALRPARDDDVPAVKAAYRRWAAARDGQLDRGDYIWGRVLSLRKPGGAWEPARGYLVEGAGGALEGYVYHGVRATEGGHWHMTVTDAVALTPAAGRRLLTFFADQRPICETVVWHGAAGDTLTALLPEQTVQVKLFLRWALRVVDVKVALEARGWPAGAAGELHFDVRDAALPANAGRWRLRVEGGAATVSPGGEGRVTLDVRGLAALYSGYLSPVVLAAAGLLSAPDADLARAATLFAGPAPAMTDSF